MRNIRDEFYYSKSRLSSFIIVSTLLGLFGVFIMLLAESEGDGSFIVVGLLITIIFFTHSIANILKLARDYPYIIITDEYIQIDSFTGSEITAYFKDIEYIRAGELQLHPLIEIELYEQDEFFENLSFYNKLRLFINNFQGVSIITISGRILGEKEHIRLINSLNNAIKKMRDEKGEFSIPLIAIAENKNQFKSGEYLQEYQIKPKVDRSIDGFYILKSYKNSFNIFKLSFIFIYWLLGLEDQYLLYILANLILYPIAKLPFDYWFGFRFNQMYRDPRVIGSYRHESSSYILSFILFQIGIFIAPIGLLFLLVRKITSESNSVKVLVKDFLAEVKREISTINRRQRNKNLLMIIIFIIAINFNFIEILDLIEEYPGWLFSLFPLIVLISQILAIRKIKIYEKKKKASLTIHFFIGIVFLVIFYLVLNTSSNNDISSYIIYLLIAMTNFLVPFSSGLTSEGLYYRQFGIRSFLGYKPVYYEYKELSSLEFEIGEEEIRLLIHANILKANTKKTLRFPIKDITAINKIVNKFN